jgi:hypothetical protein
MSTLPIHTPQHSFTSTLDHKQHISAFNVWIVILTAFFFFLVLSIYNFFLAVYNYIIKNNPDDMPDYNRHNLFNIYATFGFMLLWGIFTIILYILLNKFNLLTISSSLDTHPLLRDEARTVTGSLRAL